MRIATAGIIGFPLFIVLCVVFIFLQIRLSKKGGIIGWILPMVHVILTLFMVVLVLVNFSPGIASYDGTTRRQILTGLGFLFLFWNIPTLIYIMINLYQKNRMKKQNEFDRMKSKKEIDKMNIQDL